MPIRRKEAPMPPYASPADLLAEIRRRHGFTSDREIAARVGRDRVRVAMWKSGASVPDDAAALKLAELAGVNPEVMLVQACAWRADGDIKKKWEKIVKNMMRSAAVLAVPMLLILAAQPINGHATYAHLAVTSSPLDCIL